MKSCRVLIFGGSGQDGTILGHLYSEKGIDVTLLGRNFSKNTKSEHPRIKKIISNLETLDVQKTLRQERPDIILYAAAFHGSAGFLYEESINEAFDINVRIPVEILKYLSKNKSAKFAFFNSSKVFDFEKQLVINEQSMRRPGCIYSLQKEMTYKAIQHYRSNYDVKAYNFWLFNHESEYRTKSFFIPIVLSTLQKSRANRDFTQKINTLNFFCDWGVARDYMRAVMFIIDNSKCDDFIIGSGKTRTGRELANELFEHFGLKYQDHFIEQTAVAEANSRRWSVDNKKLTSLYKEEMTDIVTFCVEQVQKRY